jgi:hypothetical protein
MKSRQVEHSPPGFPETVSKGASRRTERRDLVGCHNFAARTIRSGAKQILLQPDRIFHQSPAGPTLPRAHRWS